jgi:hypothetical protein
VIASLLVFAVEFEAKAVNAAIRENDAKSDRHPSPAVNGTDRGPTE